MKLTMFPMLKKEAVKITHTLSNPSKMPGKSYSLPAWECQTGSKLSKIPGTPCYDCYAKKNNYIRYPDIKKAQYKRFAAIDNPAWVDGMVTMISGEKWFRWHDAGDVQSKKHMADIIEIAKRLPETNFWLPTIERQYLPTGKVPENLAIRLSSTKIDGQASRNWPTTSTVVTSGATCPAPQQKGKCGDCRMCWNKSIKNIAYSKH